MTLLTEIKQACSDEHQAALRRARTDCDAGILMGRGKHFRVIKGDQIVAGEADSWQRDGSGAQLRKAIEFAKENGDALYIDGGINWRADLRDDCYDPWVAEWSVTVWSASNETNVKDVDLYADYSSNRQGLPVVGATVLSAQVVNTL